MSKITGPVYRTEVGRNYYVKIYKEPSGNSVIGGDTAGEGSDFFVAQVLDANGTQCAVLHHQFDEDLYVRQVYCLGTWYRSLIAIEANFGPLSNRELQRLRYPSLYVRETYDQIGMNAEEKYGFKTTQLTRPLIINQLVEIVREHTSKINDRETLQEMLSFVRNEKKNGRPEASQGAHDDLVMGLAIAYEALHQLPAQRPVIKKVTRDEDLAFFDYQ